MASMSIMTGKILKKISFPINHFVFVYFIFGPTSSIFDLKPKIVASDRKPIKLRERFD